jgi:hypothetical protein
MQNTFCIDAELLSTTLDMLFAKHSVAVISGTSHAHGDYWCGLCARQADRLRVRWQPLQVSPSEPIRLVSRNSR